MGFQIETLIYCDETECGRWFDGSAVISDRIEKRKAWEEAVDVGWMKIKGQHRCPKCVQDIAREAKTQGDE